VGNQQLKEVGLKITLPRMKVLNILEAHSSEHLSAEKVYKLLLKQEDDVGLATVYRVLTQFEDAGLVTRHNFEGGYAVFELSDGLHHDHLVCTKCDIIKEFVDEVIEQRQIDIANNHGFQITDHSLNIYGLCPSCQSA
tara:strand:- start:54 stop:467 length:414 start_codon:yes stop_codon:yes gene_type:complete